MTEKRSTLPDSFLEMKNWAALFLGMLLWDDVLDLIRTPTRWTCWVWFMVELMLAAMWAVDLTVTYLEDRQSTPDTEPEPAESAEQKG